jgi:hypothetical protein
MVTGGLYKHKSGNLYRVLFVAEWVWDGRSPIADAELLVIARPAPAVQLRAGGGLYGKLLFTAKWSSNTNEVFEGQAIVIYIALYGEGRVAARRLKEFEEAVETAAEAAGPGSTQFETVPRFERIGD